MCRGLGCSGKGGHSHPGMDVRLGVDDVMDDHVCRSL